MFRRVLGLQNLFSVVLGSSWSFQNHDPSALSVSRNPHGAPRSPQSHDLTALSVSGRLTSHDLSCLSVSGGLPECSEVTIYRACRCLEASRGAPGHVKIQIHRPCRCPRARRRACASACALGAFASSRNPAAGGARGGRVKRAVKAKTIRLSE